MPCEFDFQFNKLNSYQKAAVVSDEKYAILNAMVGSGKTTVLVNKVIYLHFIKKVPLESMIVLTFTNRAADEIANRIKEYGDDLENGMKFFGTFHSVARKILSESFNLSTLGYTPDFQIIDDTESYQMLTNLIDEKKLKIKYKEKTIKRIEECKKGKKLYGSMKKLDDIEKLLDIYKNEKVRKNIMDFDDIIENCTKVIKEPINPKWIIVDEFQDTDLMQLELIKKIAGCDTSIFVIGDPNQIIYSFRNGTNKIFEAFKKAYNPVQYDLPLNYRSSMTIVKAAEAFIGNEKIDGINEYGSPIIIKKHYDSFNEALHIARKIKKLNEDGVCLNDIAVLYRRQVQSEIITRVFDSVGVLYSTVLKKEEQNEDNESSLKNDGVNLLTLHASKGLEFSYVFITGVNAGNIPISPKREEEEEEARLFFVGITRAKKFLEISYVAKPELNGVSGFASPYISMLPSNLVYKDDKISSNSLNELVKKIKEERALKEQCVKRVMHEKYGTGSVLYEDDNKIKVNFDDYGEKEFIKAFCKLKTL